MSVIALKPSDLTNLNSLINLRVEEYLSETTVKEFCEVNKSNGSLCDVLENIDEFLRGVKDNVLPLAITFKVMPDIEIENIVKGNIDLLLKAPLEVREIASKRVVTWDEFLELQMFLVEQTMI
jgi:hypothetical protein